MSDARKQARRYHWLSGGLKSFVDDPHAAIEGIGQGEIIIVVGPDKITVKFAKLETLDVVQTQPDQLLLPHLIMPAHHDIRASDIVTRRLSPEFQTSHAFGGRSVFGWEAPARKSVGAVALGGLSSRNRR
jgi:hypothetical protein